MPDGIFCVKRFSSDTVIRLLVPLKEIDVTLLHSTNFPSSYVAQM
uniref:Uncharacterized protein n=1 Tax=Myoviridae sp. ct3mI7 TaxID=2825028 RepID=A0A8S5QJ71_9CAUD|nr:MAG TPA: hypothetical protein [Myoviridae sp. ct3mI7]